MNYPQLCEKLIEVSLKNISKGHKHEKSHVRAHRRSLRRHLPGNRGAEKRGSYLYLYGQQKAEKGGLFVPIKGARADGHAFIEQVMKQGALATLSEKDLGEQPYPYIQVKSSLTAVKDIAEYYLKQLSIPVVGITGSVGKTSTKEMIAAVLSQKYNTLKTQGNFNNELGLPLTVFRLRDEHEMAVLEMGISDFGEMHRWRRLPDRILA